MERDFVYVHTPIISGQDCEGAGEMFQVTTLDLEELSQGKKLDYREDFFERETSLTVSGQLNGEPLPRLSEISIRLDRHFGRRKATLPGMRQNFG